MTETTVTVLPVSGMTCGHCVQAVTTELMLVSGVRSVDVDLSTGSVTVTSDGPLGEGVVREAVEEAGYELSEPA